MPHRAAAYLYIWPGQFLFVGQALNTHIHDHHAVQLVISLDTPFRMRVGKDEWHPSRGVLIAPDQPHECLADASTVLFLNLDPASTAARRLVRRPMGPGGFADLPEPVLAPLLAALPPLLPRPDSCAAVLAVLNTFFDRLTDAAESPPLDDRIRKVQSRLATELLEPPALAALADEACLSPGRLVHLFKQQVGIPIRKYVLWQRLLRAIGHLTRGDNLTEAAHGAGFADSAHFSRTFTRMFGLSPSLITKNSQFVQARVCG